MKKGFTLVELLGVIIIIGIIALIITPSLMSTLDSSEEKAYKKQLNIIENAAKEWGVENIDYLPDATSSVPKIISLDTLMNSGKIQNSTILDPRSENEMRGCVVVSFNSKYNQYEYKYNEDESYCESLSTKLCRPAKSSEVTTGNVPEGQYVYGDEYICNLGETQDSKNLIFFMLENSGDNVSLIMNKNLGENIGWCSDNTLCKTNGSLDNTKGPITANEALIDRTSSWTKLNQSQIALPTYNQIYNAVDNKEGSLPTWLYDYMANTTNPVSGVSFYWTSSSSTGKSYAKVVNYTGFTQDCIINSTSVSGIRPVITISKDSL